MCFEVLDDTHGWFEPKKKTWNPDCSIRPLGEVIYFELTSRMYWAAVKASRGSVNSEELEKELMTMANEQEQPLLK